MPCPSVGPKLFWFHSAHPNVDINLKPWVLIKSSYYIVPSPFTALKNIFISSGILCENSEIFNIYLEKYSFDQIKPVLTIKPTNNHPDHG